jgi:hypothetical protein
MFSVCLQLAAAALQPTSRGCHEQAPQTGYGCQQQVFVAKAVFPRVHERFPQVCHECVDGTSVTDSSGSLEVSQVMWGDMTPGSCACRSKSTSAWHHNALQQCQAFGVR